MSDERVGSTSLVNRNSVTQLLQTGDLISQAMLFFLGRKYLDASIFEKGWMQIQEASTDQRPEYSFIKLNQVGKPASDDYRQYWTAIRTAIAAAHDPLYTLLFVVHSDGIRNHIYFGLRAKGYDTQSRLFANQLGQFINSNWPGTHLTACENKEVVDQIIKPLSEYTYGRAFTGIPSIKGEDAQAYPQSLDLFMRGLRGKPYLYMVIADPLAEEGVDEIIQNCRRLSGSVHAFTKASLQQSLSEALSTGTSHSESEASTTSKTSGESKSASEGKSIGAFGSAIKGQTTAGKVTKGAGMLGITGLTAAVGGPFLLSGLLGMFSQLMPSTTNSEMSGSSTSDSISDSRTTGVTETEGTTSSESLSFGREYLNKHAEACEKLLEKTIERFEIARGQGCWNVGYYLLSKQDEISNQGQAQLKAVISGEKSSFEPVRSHDLKSVWKKGVGVTLTQFHQPAIKLYNPESETQATHPLGEAFNGLTTLLNTEELSLLVNLPIRETHGIPVKETAHFSLNPANGSGLVLGNLIDEGDESKDLTYEVDINSLSRHLFITGITGSGKSNTCRRLLTGLLEQKKNFMVIEPAKDEYVQLAREINKYGKYPEIFVYVPGRQRYPGLTLQELRLNPFSIVRLEKVDPQVMPHLDRMKAIFNASFPMQEVLPLLLEEALVILYDNQGWFEKDLPEPNKGYPTLEELVRIIEMLIETKGYDEKIKGNLTAALKTRIGNLLHGWKMDLFNQSSSTSYQELFERPVVINLQQMGDDADKSFTMALLLNYLYEYRVAQYEQAQYEQEQSGREASSSFRHLAVFEEAHRILRAVPPSASGEGNPRAKVGEMFSDILAEIRAYGQGLAIIDQVPSKLVPDALKNTNLKIVHRLVAADDRQALAGILSLTDDQTKIIARLQTGQAIVAGFQDDMASWVKILDTPIPGARTNP